MGRSRRCVHLELSAIPWSRKWQYSRLIVASFCGVNAVFYILGRSSLILLSNTLAFTSQASTQREMKIKSETQL